jgi:uncharacterized OB-fold protein
MEEKETELLTIHSALDAEQPFRWGAGRYRSRFFMEIRDHKKIYGIKCPKCGKVYVPPKRVCGPCFAEMDEPVEVGLEGEILTYTILRFSFVDPETGVAKPVPYAYGVVRLDGADTQLSHFIEYKDETKVRIGARVRVVFQEAREGNIKDIKTFELIES